MSNFIGYFGSRGTKSEGGYQVIHPVRVDICDICRTIFSAKKAYTKVNKVSLFSVFNFFNNWSESSKNKLDLYNPVSLKFWAARNYQFRREINKISYESKMIKIYELNLIFMHLNRNRNLNTVLIYGALREFIWHDSPSSPGPITVSKKKINQSKGLFVSFAGALTSCFCFSFSPNMLEM